MVRFSKTGDAMAEETLEKEIHFHFSRNLKKAMERNTIKNDSLQKDLDYMQRQRRILAHSWETKKREFALRHKSSIRPVIRVGSGEENQEVSSEQNPEQRLSKRSGTRQNKMDNSLTGENKLGRRHSGDNKLACVHSKLGSSEPNLACMPLTVKDISRILSTDKNLPTIVNNVRCVSPSTPKHTRTNSFHTSIKETAARNEGSSPRYPLPPTQYVRRAHRTRSLDPSELNKSTREDTLMQPSSPGVPLRKRSSTWGTRHSETNQAGLRSEHSDSESRNSHSSAVKVCASNQSEFILTLFCTT